MAEKHPIYKITPYHIEKRGNLKMVGSDSLVEFQQLKNMMVIHVKEDMNPDAMSSLAFQLKTVFGEDTLLVAFKEDVSFFVAQAMSEEDVKIFNDIVKEELNNLINENLKQLE